MRLSKNILDKLDKEKIDVFEARRDVTEFWNQRRGTTEPRFFCGWYWYTKRNPNDLNGPFKTNSAALRDAYVRVSLKLNSMIDAGSLQMIDRKQKGGR